MVSMKCSGQRGQSYPGSEEKQPVGRFRHLNPECCGRPLLRLDRFAYAESGKGTHETKNSGDKQRSRIGYLDY